MNLIRKSITSPTGKESSTRIAFYVMLLLIVIFAVTFLVMAILNYTISNEILIVFASLLTHSLTLIGINKRYEAKVNGNGKNGKTNDNGGKKLMK